MYIIYKIRDRETIARLSDGASIPKDEANNDYQDYLKWVAEGNVTEEWVAE